MNVIILSPEMHQNYSTNYTKMALKVVLLRWQDVKTRSVSVAVSMAVLIRDGPRWSR